jgi:argininosuccinate synthase
MSKVAKKVVLAYSGGLDTSVAIKWLLEHKCEEVVAVAIDLGQGAELEPVQAKALKIGASESQVIDAQEDFIKNYCFQALKANASYEENYPLATALARPLIAKILVDIAHKYKADAIAHGCTGKGNDQVRFDLSIMALDPDLKIIAPAREWGMSRDVLIEYADNNDIPIPITKANPYSIDLNLYGRSAECGVLEDLKAAPPEDCYGMTKSPENASDTAEYVEIEFKKGEPIALNGSAKDPVTLVAELNDIGGRNAIGRIDKVENRVVGIKSREIYEAPAAVILTAAHKELEYVTMTKNMKDFKQKVDTEYAELVYKGFWFEPLRVALDAFLESSQEHVTGKIKLKLYKGNLTVESRESPYSLYDKGMATYDKDDQFNHMSAVGFIELFGLEMKTHAIVTKNQSKNEALV